MILFAFNMATTVPIRNLLDLQRLCIFRDGEVYPGDTVPGEDVPRGGTDRLGLMFRIPTEDIFLAVGAYSLKINAGTLIAACSATLSCEYLEMTPLRHAQFSMHLLLAILKRRKFWLVVPLLVVTAICSIGAYLLPRRYESSTTIWVQRDEILNPLVSFTMAVQMASEDRLRTFNEIVYSRQTIETLLDSLSLRGSVPPGLAWDELVDRTKASIKTDRNGADSFTMTFADTDPVRAQHAVTLLSELFKNTRLKSEFDRNEYTVEFFQNKLREYEAKYGETQASVVSLLKQRAQEMPGGSTSLSTRFDQISERARETSERLRDRQRALANVGLFPGAFRTERGRAALSDLQAEGVPNAAELRALTDGYDSVTVRYTEKHPEVGKFENRIMDLLERTRVTLQSDISGLSAHFSDMQKNQNEIVQAMTQSSISQKVDADKESNYTFFQQLYSDMRVKLEQARIAQELGKNAEKSFVILDPARIPTRPTKPNRMLIIVGGMFAGMLLGIMCAGAAELMDTTIRSPREIETYKKPIIALLPEGVRRS